jgi:uncharacterized membrane protein YhiD involved in acid resistance
MELRIGATTILWSTTLAFVLSTVVAWVYVLTYSGLSYSRSFVQSLAVSASLSAMVMLAIGSDIARGLGLMGALSLVRYRVSLKEPRDLMFVFASLGVGVACGVQAYGVAVLGTAVFAVTTLYVSWSSFGSQNQFDAVLRLRVSSQEHQRGQLRVVLERYCESHSLLNLRDLGDEGQEHSYQLKLFDVDATSALSGELNQVEGVSAVTILMQDKMIEV